MKRPSRRGAPGGSRPAQEGEAASDAAPATGQLFAERVPLGRFGAPHGVRGEIRLQSFTRDPLAIAGYGPLLAGDGRRFTLTQVRSVKEAMLIARVAGIVDRTAAAALTGIELAVERAALPPPDEADEFYIADLIGMEAVDAEGRVLGRVADVPNYGGGDLVEIQPAGGGETLLLPFRKEVVTAIDLTEKRLTIVPPAEVAEGWPADV